MNNSKRFDKIIMNPPYERSLHLKILENTLKYIDKDGKIINLSPIRWLLDPLAKYKKNSDYIKFEKTISKHIEKLEIIESLSAAEIFSAGIWCDLGIYVCNSTGGFDYKIKYDDFMEKVIIPLLEGKEKSVSLVMIDNQVHNKPFAKFSTLHGHQGKNDFYEFVSDNFELFSTNKGKGTYYKYVLFDTDDEVKNFHKYVRSNFAKEICLHVKQDMHVPWFCLPWLGDKINPRTNIKGYKEEWTEDDLNLFFKLS